MSVVELEQVQLSEKLETEWLVDHFPHLAEELGSRAVILVRADTRESGSFKSRGAKNAISKLPVSTREVVAASAGNHARGVAVAAARQGLRATIVVPNSAPEQKSEGIYRLWDENRGHPGELRVVKYGDNFDETLKFALEQYPDAHFIHPYDDPDVIEGQGSVMHDIEAVVPGVTDVIVPVGGGGLLAGMVAKSNGARIWGIEAPGSDSLSRSLNDLAGRLLEASAPNVLYAGCAVKKTGKNGIELLRSKGFNASHLVTAHDSDALDLAVAYYRNGERPDEQLEPTSLLAIAGLKKMLREGKFSEQSVIAVVGTGHNESPQNLVRAHREQQHRMLGGFIGGQ